MHARLDLAARRVYFRGQGYWNIKDPLSSRFYQLRDEEYFILQQLDGQTSLREVQTRFQKEFAPRRLSLEQLNWFLGSLHRESLIVSDAAGQGEQLLARRRKAERTERLARWTNVLAIRFRGIDPTRLLNGLYPFFGWLFHPIAQAAGGGLVLAALAWALLHWQALTTSLPTVSEFFSVSNLLLLALALGIVKIIHELAHGLTCRHFGGQCRELGAMLLVFTPCLYCNVSDAWLLPSKWRRIAISAAGIVVELWIAAGALFFWWFSEPGTLQALALNLVAVCSLGTLLFNGNPLLRYDGYFILADWLETPNLNEQAMASVRRPLLRWCFGIDTPPSPLDTPVRRGWLVIYSVAATLYRWALMVAILWMCYAFLETYRLEVFWYVLAGLAVGTMVFGPLWQSSQFLRDPRRRRRMRPARTTFSLLALVTLMGVVLLVPFPRRVTAPALLRSADTQTVYVKVSGTLTHAVKVGTEVSANDELARLADPQLEFELTRLAADVALQRLHVEMLERQEVHDPRGGVESAAGQLPAARDALAALQERLSERQKDQQDLILRAAVGGKILPPRQTRPTLEKGELPIWSGSPLDEANRGAFLERGTRLCQIATSDRMEAMLIVPQHDIALLEVGQVVRLRLAELPGAVLTGTISEIADIDLENLPEELLASGLIPLRHDERTAATPTYTSYEVRVTLDDLQTRVPTRLTANCRIRVPPANLLERLKGGGRMKEEG